MLKYAALSGAGWDIQTVDSGGDVGYYSSLALGTNGYPHISYFDYTNRDLRYAAWNGSSWDIQTVDSSWDVGRYSSLALDVNGYPHIAYYDHRALDLKYAAWNGTSWDIEAVDTRGDVGRSNSLALDPMGHPHISCYDATNQDPKYATTQRPARALHELLTAGYYMISLPFTPTSVTPKDVLSDDLGDGGYYMWRWDGGGYATVPTSTPESQSATLSVQEGYWILAPAATLDIDIGGTLPHGDQAIPLQAG